MYPKNGNTVDQHKVNGRTFQASVGYQDVADHDADMLQANGWVRGGKSGVTSARPTNPGRGDQFIDTTLAAVIMWDGAAWRNVLTGAVA
jgi:hypothetical protein